MSRKTLKKEKKHNNTQNVEEVNMNMLVYLYDVSFGQAEPTIHFIAWILPIGQSCF